MRYIRFGILILALLLATHVVIASHRTNHPSNLNDSVTTSSFNYTLYYTDDNPPPTPDPDYFPASQANQARDAVHTTNTSDPAFPGHHQRFLDIGFNAPFFRTTPPEIYIYDSSNLGGAYFDGIDLDAPGLRSSSEMEIRMVTGHELFHHVQYGYIDDGSIGGCGGTWGKWTCEGTARMMQDKVYADLDADTGTTQASYIGEISNYMSNPNRSLVNLSYQAVLFWNYLTERLGTVTTEPQRGVDVIEKYWDNTSSLTTSPDAMQALRDTIKDFDISLTLEQVFLDFAITNYTKDLDVTALPDAVKYRYVDDDTTPYATLSAVAGNDSNGRPTYRTGTVSPTSNIGPINDSVFSFAAKYAVASVDSSCQIVGFTSTGDSLGYGLVTVKGGNRADAVYKSTTTSFNKAFMNRSADPYTQLAVTFAGMDSAANFTYSFVCGGADLTIVRPTTSFPARVGPHDAPERFLVVLNVYGPPELGTPSVQGLDISDFEVYVGSETPADQATVLAGAYVQGSYWLVAQAPTKPADGDYALVVKLGDLSTAQKTGVVRYSSIVQDQVLVIDESGSMINPTSSPKWEAAQNAGRLFVDAARSTDQLGVVKFSGDGVEPNIDASVEFLLQGVAGNRNAAKAKVNGIKPPNGNPLTSIGDGLKVAQTNELDVRGKPDGDDVLILLSDGMENEPDYWSNVRSLITGRGTIVHAIALGPGADQALMQSIATDTGGDYLYVDLQGASFFMRSAPDGTPQATTLELPNRLADGYRTVNEQILRHQRLWQDSGVISPKRGVRKTIELKESSVEEGIFSFNWSKRTGAIVRILRPDGTEVRTGDPGVSIYQDNTHTVFHIAKMMQGTWTVDLISQEIAVDYVASLSGKVRKGVRMDVWFAQTHNENAMRAANGIFLRGLPMPILAVLTDIKGPVRGANVVAMVEHPDGSLETFRLYDDGNHTDNAANDGVYGVLYTRTTAASTFGVSDRNSDQDKGTRGSYIVTVMAEGENNVGEPFRRYKKSAFQVFENDGIKDLPNPDPDEDGMPSRWERLYGLDPKRNDAREDPDEDGLTNLQEYLLGTNPMDPDTDDGGESDGSEVERQANPLNPDDDGRCPPLVDVGAFVADSNDSTRITLFPNANLIHFPASAAYQEIRLYRSMQPNGPFTLVARIDPRQYKGMYQDTGLKAGLTYYYKLQAIGQGKCVTPYSRVFSATPREEPYAPRGYVLINDGAPMTDSTWVTLRLGALKRLVSSTQYPEYTSDGLEMIISNSPDFSDTQWEPYQTTRSWKLEPDKKTGQATVYVKYRDREGQESMVETDGIRVVRGEELGGIRGEVLLDPPGDLRGSTFSVPEEPNSPPAFSDAEGRVLLSPLQAGAYDMRVEHKGYSPVVLQGIEVAAGRITDIGRVILRRYRVYVPQVIKQ